MASMPGVRRSISKRVFPHVNIDLAMGVELLCNLSRTWDESRYSLFAIKAGSCLAPKL